MEELDEVELVELKVVMEQKEVMELEDPIEQLELE